MNGRRLSPQEIAENFAAMKRDHEQRVERSRRNRARKAQEKDTREYLAKQSTPSVGPSIGEQLRDKYREGYRVRNNRGHFIGLPKNG